MAPKAGPGRGNLMPYPPWRCEPPRGAARLGWCARPDPLVCAWSPPRASWIPWTGRTTS